MCPIAMCTVILCVWSLPTEEEKVRELCQKSVKLLKNQSFQAGGEFKVECVACHPSLIRAHQFSERDTTHTTYFLEELDLTCNQINWLEIMGQAYCECSALPSMRGVQ
eukprot:scaffold16716_cov146-Skeletonema_dohrnii-CCMP3373.AAC.26